MGSREAHQNVEITRTPLPLLSATHEISSRPVLAGGGEKCAARAAREPDVALARDKQEREKKDEGVGVRGNWMGKAITQYII